jgi:hypothetical protein
MVCTLLCLYIASYVCASVLRFYAKFVMKIKRELRLISLVMSVYLLVHLPAYNNTRPTEFIFIIFGTGKLFCQSWAHSTFNHKVKLFQ